MEELLLINPRKRRAGGRRKTRTAAQRAATKRMLAANRAKRGHNPIRRRRAARTTAVATPARRRRSVRAAVRHHRKTRRHNPIGSGGMTGLIKGAFTGAVGVVAVNAAFNYLPIPATMKTGYASHAVKGALAVTLGLVGRRFLGAKAAKMAEGSLTVTLAQVISDLAGKAGVNLSGVSYYSPAMQFSSAPQALPGMMNGMGDMNAYMSGVGDAYGSDGTGAGFDSTY